MGKGKNYHDRSIVLADCVIRRSGTGEGFKARCRERRLVGVGEKGVW